MADDLFGSFKPRGADWDTSDHNLIFVSLPGTEALRSEVQDRGEGLREKHGLGPLRKARVQHVTFSHFGHFGHIPDAIEAVREIGRAMTIKRSVIVLDNYAVSFCRTNTILSCWWHRKRLTRSNWRTGSWSKGYGGSASNVRAALTLT